MNTGRTDAKALETHCHPQPHNGHCSFPSKFNSSEAYFQYKIPISFLCRVPAYVQAFKKLFEFLAGIHIIICVKHGNKQALSRPPGPYEKKEETQKNWALLIQKIYNADPLYAPNVVKIYELLHLSKMTQ